jgi:hypothetical protein
VPLNRARADPVQRHPNLPTLSLRGAGLMGSLGPSAAAGVLPSKSSVPDQRMGPLMQNGVILGQQASTRLRMEKSVEVMVVQGTHWEHFPKPIICPLYWQGLQLSDQLLQRMYQETASITHTHGLVREALADVAVRWPRRLLNLLHSLPPCSIKIYLSCNKTGQWKRWIKVVNGCDCVAVCRDELGLEEMARQRMFSTLSPINVAA